jgi:hypothetical protein
MGVVCVFRMGAYCRGRGRGGHEGVVLDRDVDQDKRVGAVRVCGVAAALVKVMDGREERGRLKKMRGTCMAWHAPEVGE